MLSGAQGTSFQKNMRSILEARETERKLKSELEQLDEELHRLTDANDPTIFQKFSNSFNNLPSKSSKPKKDSIDNLSPKQYVDIVEKLREKLESTILELDNERQKVKKLEIEQNSNKSMDSNVYHQQGQYSPRSSQGIAYAGQLGQDSRKLSNKATSGESDWEYKSNPSQDSFRNNNELTHHLGAEEARNLNSTNRTFRNENDQNFNTNHLNRTYRSAELELNTLGQYKNEPLSLGQQYDYKSFQQKHEYNSQFNAASQRINDDDENDEIEELRAENETLKMNIKLLQNHNEMLQQQLINERRNRKLVTQHCKTLEVLIAEQKEEVNNFILKNRSNIQENSSNQSQETESKND